MGFESQQPLKKSSVKHGVAIATPYFFPPIFSSCYSLLLENIVLLDTGFSITKVRKSVTKSLRDQISEQFKSVIPDFRSQK
jgi:hypothetical protein